MHEPSPGDRVRVRIPRTEPCRLPAQSTVPVLDAIGTADRVGERFGDHCVVVVINLWHQDTRWTDRIKPSELVPA